MVGSVSSLLSFIVTWVIVIVSIFMATSNWQVFVNPASILVVVGGTIASEFIGRGFRETSKAFLFMFSSFLKQPMKSKHFSGEINRIKGWADQVLSGGKRAYDEIYSEVSDPFEKYVFSILSTGYSTEESRDFIANEIQREYQLNERRTQILTNLGGSAPAFGMLGTLIGLVILLSQLDDPSKIGPAMAVALITTFYGLLLARLFFIPAANKSFSIAEAVFFKKMMLMEGVYLIMQDKSSFYIEDFLRSYVDKGKSDSVGEEEEIISDSNI